MFNEHNNFSFRVLDVSASARVIPGKYGMSTGFVITGEETDPHAGNRLHLFVAAPHYFCYSPDPQLEVFCRYFECLCTVENGDVLDVAPGRIITLADGRTATLCESLRLNDDFVIRQNHEGIDVTPLSC